MGTHTQSTGLKRPNTIRFVNNAMEITPEEVYQAVSKELQTTKATKCIAQLYNGWYNITLIDESQCDVIATGGLTINGMLIQCECANILNSIVAYVKAPYAPVTFPPIIYYWNKVTVHHLKLCYFLMKKDNTMICGVLLNHCLTVNRIISKSVCLDTRLRDTSLKRCGVKSQFTNSVSCVSIIGVDASLTTTTHIGKS